MRPTLLLAAALALVNVACPQTPATESAPKGSPHLSASARAKLFAPDFQIVRSVAKVPSACMLGFAKGLAGENPRIADPGQRFEETDVVTDRKLPRRRLVFAGIAAHRCFLYYERGGLGHTYNVAVIDLDSTSVVWSAYLLDQQPAKDLDELRKRVPAGLEGLYSL